MDRQDLSALIVLKAVAEAGSFTRASRQLNRAQSGVSQTIRELEARLGIALLARTTRSVRLTEAGSRLLEDVGPALMQISDSLTRAKSGATEPAGTVRITTLEHPGQTILKANIPVFRPHPAQAHAGRVGPGSRFPSSSFERRTFCIDLLVSVSGTHCQ